MNSSREVIASFFDCYDLPAACSLLRKTIKTAGSEKVWKGTYPADVLYFTGMLEGLMEAAFSIIERYDFRPEVEITSGDLNDPWFLNKYEIYCGWHTDLTPWDFFPRYLSKKEFLDPYRALRKFTRYRSLTSWKQALKELLEYALSPHSINDFDDGTSMLGTWIYLHKLIEASHLIEVRYDDEVKRPRFKWKDRENLLNKKDETLANNQHL